jgi:hypothetical protein
VQGRTPVDDTAAPAAVAAECLGRGIGMEQSLRPPLHPPFEVRQGNIKVERRLYLCDENGSGSRMRQSGRGRRFAERRLAWRGRTGAVSAVQHSCRDGWRIDEPEATRPKNYQIIGSYLVLNK